MYGLSTILNATQFALPFRTIEDRCPKSRGGSELGVQPSTASLKGLACKRPKGPRIDAFSAWPVRFYPRASCFALQNFPVKFYKCPVFGQFPRIVRGRTG